MRALIYGSGAQGRVTLDVLRAMRTFERVELVDDDASRWGQSIDGATVIGGFEAMVARGTDASVIVALGNPVARLALAKRVTDSGLSLLNAVHPTAAIASTASLGRGNFVGIGAVVCAGARVGDNCVLNNGSMLEHDSILADGVQLAPRSVVAARDTIDRGAFVCVGATILSRLRVGAYSVVGAGALVNRDVPAGVFVAGAPARMIERAGETFDWGRLL